MAIALLLEQTCGEVFQTANVNWMDSSRDPVNVKKLVGAQKVYGADWPIQKDFQ
jgi:hypothetical protein